MEVLIILRGTAFNFRRTMAPLVEMEKVFMEEAEVEVTSTIEVEVKEVLTMVTEAIIEVEVTSEVEVEVDHPN